jgi:hypothetical protein
MAAAWRLHGGCMAAAWGRGVWLSAGGACDRGAARRPPAAASPRVTTSTLCDSVLVALLLWLSRARMFACRLYTGMVRVGLHMRVANVLGTILCNVY